MRTSRLLSVLAVVALGSVSCGSASQVPDAQDTASPAAPASPSVSQTAPSGSAADARVPATPRGLAAAVLRHLDGHPVGRITGGRTDMEDQRLVSVGLEVGDGREWLSVQGHDPAYLPGDRGPDACPGRPSPRVRQGLRTDCSVLADGTVVLVYAMSEGFSDGNTEGSFMLAYAEGPGRSVQVAYESYRPDATLTLADVRGIVRDPSVGWFTTAALNRAGEPLALEADRDLPGDAEPAEPERDRGHDPEPDPGQDPAHAEARP